MRSPLPAAALLLLTFCTPGNDRQAAETASDGAGGLSSRDTMPAPAPSANEGAADATTPAAILSQMNVTNTAEIQLARMAAKKASSPDVKKMAEKLAVEHSKNREQVRALAQKLGASMTPVAGGDVTTSDSAAVPSDLQKSGAEFDRAFLQHQVIDHESNIKKIQNQMLPSVQDPQVKMYLQRTLADMQGHLASLKEVQLKIGS